MCKPSGAQIQKTSVMERNRGVTASHKAVQCPQMQDWQMVCSTFMCYSSRKLTSQLLSVHHSFNPMVMGNLISILIKMKIGVIGVFKFIATSLLGAEHFIQN